MAFLVALLLFFSCVSCTAPRPLAPRDLLTKAQFAYTRLNGREIICAHAERTSCGLHLTQCSDGFTYECSIDVMVIDLDRMKEISERAKGEGA